MPFRFKNSVKIYLDESLKSYEIVYPAAGDVDAAVKLTVSQLTQITATIG